MMFCDGRDKSLSTHRRNNNIRHDYPVCLIPESQPLHRKALAESQGRTRGHRIAVKSLWGRQKKQGRTARHAGCPTGDTGRYSWISQGCYREASEFTCMTPHRADQEWRRSSSCD